MARVYEKLGSWVLHRELEDIRFVNIPMYDLYDDETQKEQTFPQLAEEISYILDYKDHGA